MIRRLLNLFKEKYPEKAQRFGRFFLAKEITNINLDLCDKRQPRALLCYTNMLGVNYENPCHANILHATQMIHYFVKRGYCVDICHYADKMAFKFLGHNEYDIILGQGFSYREFCINSNIPIRINFITENHPLVVKSKYEERLGYFKKRHPSIVPNSSIRRMGVLDVEQFKISTHGILMNSDFNASNFKEFKILKRINSNSIYDEKWIFEDSKMDSIISKSKNNILWFGSGGLIHKGLDILMDAMREIPNMSLNCYGIAKEEYSLFNELKSRNVYNRGRINVLSDTFCKKVVLNHNFIVFPSCSEGMSTAIATCMAYGIIPIVTKECGFAFADCIILLEDFHIECIKKTIISTKEMPNDEILMLRRKCFDYSRKHFSLKNFNESFEIIMDEILDS